MRNRVEVVGKDSFLILFRMAWDFPITFRGSKKFKDHYGDAQCGAHRSGVRQELDEVGDLDGQISQVEIGLIHHSTMVTSFQNGYTLGPTWTFLITCRAFPFRGCISTRPSLSWVWFYWIDKNKSPRTCIIQAYLSILNVFTDFSKLDSQKE